MALTQRRDSKENIEQQNIQAPQVHLEQPVQPQQLQQGQEQHEQVHEEQLKQQEQVQDGQPAPVQQDQPQQVQQEQPQQPEQQANSDSTSSAASNPVSKEQLLLKMLQDYKAHLSPEEKPKIPVTNPEAELITTEEKLSSVPASTSPAPVAIDPLTAKKLLALDDLTKATNTLIESHKADTLYKAFGAYEQALEKVRGWDPATGIGLKYTHGKKLVLGIRKLFPEIDNEAAYLAGKTMQVLNNYHIAKNQDIHAINAEQEEKKISIEDKLIAQCRELFSELEKIDYAEHDSVIADLQKILDHTAILYELVYKFNARKTGFIASVTSKLTTLPEEQLLIDLNSVKDKHEELFVNKKALEL